MDICRDLIKLCDTLLLDLDYKITPAPQLLKNVLENSCITSLGFISENSLTKKTQVNSALSKSENEELSNFLFLLGKTDVNSQKKLISGYKEYAKNSLEKYTQKYKKDSKIYVSFGFFFACVLSLIWS
jgi:stage III sporulation protein AB